MKRFNRTVENFACENCGQFIEGNGYTNHCSRCLWSKHVDINPGDRASPCTGMMEPVALEVLGQQHIILHQCKKCGFQRRQRAQQSDNFEALLELSSRPPLRR